MSAVDEQPDAGGYVIFYAVIIMFGVAIGLLATIATGVWP